ncbi:MAG TPA: two-component sensor histidine kinase [Methylophilaceae bacterium]|nr:two-component sensor histidine kinase [Methylophilaceae bacterium]HAJ72203.1 two-component sensor histidine kinase [Methylophilaceae bacterium]
MRSLRLRLVLLLSAGLGLVWLISAWFTYTESRHEIDRLFDAQLAQSAQVLLGTTHHEIHEKIEHGESEVSISHEYEQKLAFQIWGGSRLLLRASAAPITAMADNKEGYSEIALNGQSWRVFTRWDARHEFMIQVAEPLVGREYLARHITFKMLLPTFVVLPILAVLIWLGVGAGLKPLQQLKQEVEQRKANRLQPVEIAGVPEEVLPLIQALNELFARLQQAFENEQRFTADAAHELRTPLAALKIQAQVAMRTIDNEARQKVLQNLLSGVDRATRMVEQLLILARVDPEATTVNHRPVDLRTLAIQVITEIEPLAYTKQIDLVLEEGFAHLVLGDEAQLSLLLRNLLDNAIRYTPIGGRVSVSVYDRQSVVLEVRDTGPGIPKDEREQVMQRFYRISGSGEEGSGLGLSIVKRIADLHGATLVLSDNDRGSGLLVSVVWPL